MGTSLVSVNSRLGAEGFLELPDAPANRAVRDWVRAQLALIEAGCVQIEEVFLPYMVGTNGQTLFEAFKASIAGNGQRVPIVLFEGKILDGRNRMMVPAQQSPEDRLAAVWGEDVVRTLIPVSFGVGQGQRGC